MESTTSESRDFDHVARYLMKLDGAGFLDWALPERDRDLGFGRWLETQSSRSPQGDERRSDCIMELISQSGTQPPWAIVIESQTMNAPNVMGRFLEYFGRFQRELRHGPYDRDKYLIGGVLLNLTGPEQSGILNMVLPGQSKVSLSMSLEVITLTMRSASQTLASIAAGELSLSILPWVPLMEGGGEDAVLSEWGRLGMQEKDPSKRADYGTIVRTFSQLTAHQQAWAKLLEEWNVQQSPFLREWMAKGREEGRLEGREEGRLEGRQEGREEGRLEGREEGRLEERQEILQTTLLKALRRLSDSLPEELEQRVRSESNSDLLSQWFERALTCSTLDEFLADV